MILRLTLKRRWFSEIYSGRKPEEYREIKPYWEVRFRDWSRYDTVEFSNGYFCAPVMRFSLVRVRRGFGNLLWGAPGYKEVFILVLGAPLFAKNCARFGHTDYRFPVVLETKGGAQ